MSNLYNNLQNIETGYRAFHHHRVIHARLDPQENEVCSATPAGVYRHSHVQVDRQAWYKGRASSVISTARMGVVYPSFADTPKLAGGSGGEASCMGGHREDSFCGRGKSVLCVRISYLGRGKSVLCVRISSIGWGKSVHWMCIGCALDEVSLYCVCASLPLDGVSLYIGCTLDVHWTR